MTQSFFRTTIHLACGLAALFASSFAEAQWVSSRGGPSAGWSRCRSSRASRRGERLFGRRYDRCAGRQGLRGRVAAGREGHAGR